MDRKATPDDMADGDDTYSTDSNNVRKLNSKRYELTFKAGDETAILQEREFSEDGLRLKRTVLICSCISKRQPWSYLGF